LHNKYNENMSGRIDISKLKVPPEKHELETARYFASLGRDIEFIPPNNSPKMHTADIVMDGIPWEIKCPRGKSKRTVENNFRKANKQSENIIFDLRKIKLSEATCLSQLKKEFDFRPHVKRLLVIKKNNKLISFSRK